MRANFAMFEDYSHYVLNFPGSNRYQMMKDDYPADYEAGWTLSLSETA